jgi:hypothetical protein
MSLFGSTVLAVLLPILFTALVHKIPRLSLYKTPFPRIAQHLPMLRYYISLWSLEAKVVHCSCKSVNYCSLAIYAAPFSMNEVSAFHNKTVSLPLKWKYIAQISRDILIHFFLVFLLLAIRIKYIFKLMCWVRHRPPVLIVSWWGPLQWVNPLQPSIRSAGQSFLSLLLCCCSSRGCNMVLLWFPSLSWNYQQTPQNITESSIVICSMWWNTNQTNDYAQHGEGNVWIHTPQVAVPWNISCLTGS